MNGAWLDGAPTGGSDPRQPWGHDPAPLRPVAAGPEASRPRQTRQTSITERATERVSRIRQFEGLRGYSSRTTLWIKYLNYVLLVLLGCGLTGIATRDVRYANGGGTFMLFSIAVVAVVGAVSTLFYVNLRTEIVERVRHYIFGIILLPGTLLSFLLRALQEWEWINEGSLGTTLQAALPAIFLATVILPAMIFVKEMVGIRTIHRSRMDDEEAVLLWTRQDGLQR